MSKKRAAAMDLFHQKLEAHKTSTITANNHLDSRISQIENTTKCIVSDMTEKLQRFTLQQGEKLETLATKQTESFNTITEVFQTFTDYKPLNSKVPMPALKLS